MCLAVPGCIQQIYEDHQTLMGKVNFGGVVKEICLIYLPDMVVGDYVLVHAGFAISQIDEQAALATLEMFAKLGNQEELLAELNPECDT